MFLVSFCPVTFCLVSLSSELLSGESLSSELLSGQVLSHKLLSRTHYALYSPSNYQNRRKYCVCNVNICINSKKIQPDQHLHSDLSDI